MFNNIKIKTVGLLIALVLMCIVLVMSIDAYSLKKELNSVKTSWVKFNAERSTRYRMLRKLNAVLGYGGMIHNFKNYFIRRHVMYLRKSEQSIATAHFIVANYRSIADDEEQAALDNIDSMLRDYSVSLSIIERLNKTAANDELLAQKISVDDAAAINSLLFLQKKSLESSHIEGKNILKGSKVQLLNGLRSGMGYNTMIHNFKNYIIRHKLIYWNKAQQDFAYLYQVINNYQQMLMTDIESQAIEQLYAVIKHYQKNMTIARELIAKGKTLEEIDKVVAIDDQLAFNAFAMISRAINLQNEREAHSVKETLQALDRGTELRTLFIIILLILSIAAIMWLLISKIIAPVSYLTKIMQKLADNKLDTVIDIESSDNEIGIMAKTLEVFKSNAIITIKDAQLIQKIMSSAGEGIYGVDINGLVTFINPKASEMLGWQIEELPGKDIHKLCHYKKAGGEEYPAHECPTRLAMHLSHEITATEEIFWRKNGDSFPVEMTTSPLVEDDKVSGAVVLFQDVTERKRIERMKTEFISTVSHELRTPLTSIRGSLGLMMGGAVGELPAKAAELLKIASNNTERLLILINDILDVEKIEAGSMNFQFEKLALMPMIEQVLQDNAAYAEQYGVKYVLKNIEQDATIYADKGRFMQVMANLLSNAAKFSRENENVEISVVCTQGQWVRISVTDHGFGVPATFQPILFEKFTQSDSSDSREKGGTGLGLSITKAIVAKHNGVLDFVSREGVGSTFFVDFPSQAPIKTDNLIKQTSPEDNLGYETVLIIEDDEDVATLLRMMLTQGGYNSDIAYTLNEARQFVHAPDKTYKAITLDLVLSGENGIDFLDELRQHNDTKNIPVVVVSARADETRKALNGGALALADWLNKPIDESRLLRVIGLASRHGSKPRVLHVEDDDDVYTVIACMLVERCELIRASTLAQAKALLASQQFDLVMLDIGLPDGSGLDLLETIEQCPKPPKTVIFSASDVSQKYADRVNAVLMKSKTDNSGLFETINTIINEK